MGLFSRRRGPSASAETEAEARAIAAMALACAGADGHVDPAEIAEIKATAERLPAFRRVGPKMLEDMLRELGASFPKRGALAILQEAKDALSPDLRETAFFVAARVANADGKVEGSEQQYLINLARHLELPSEVSVRLYADAVVNLETVPQAVAQSPSVAQKSCQKDSGTPRFDAYVLLSEPLQFSTAEIREALLEDFPGLDIAVGAPVVGDADCDTTEFVTAPMIMGQGGADACLTSLIRLPEYGTWDVAALPERQTRQVPDLEARMVQNASYLCISVSAKSDALQDAFRAARLSSCIAAVFARLPVALAVYWEAGDHFLSPEQVIAMADEAMEDGWPCMSWISLDVSSAPSGDTELTQVASKGLSNFLPYEFVHSFAPVTAQTAATTVMTASWMALQRGQDFNDGGTFGEMQSSIDATYMLRHIPRDVSGADTDVMALVHPQASTGLNDPLVSSTVQQTEDSPQSLAQPKAFQRALSGAHQLT